MGCPVATGCTRVRRPALGPLLLVVPALFIGALLVWPLVAVTERALRPGSGVTVDASLVGVVWFSVWQAAASTVLTLAVGLPAAWLFARVSFWGRNVLWAALVVPFVLPTVVVATAFTGLGAPRATVWTVLVAHAFFNYAVVVRVVGVAWAGLGRRPAEAAAVLGASRLRVLREVTLPMLAPSVLAAASVVYLFCFTSFGVVLLLGGSRLRTIEVEVYERLRLLDLGTAAFLALGQLVLVGVLLVVAGRWSQRWSFAGDPSSSGARRVSGWQQRLAMVGVLTSMGVLMGIPLGSLVWRSVRTSSGFGLQYWTSLGDQRGVLFSSPLEALGNSLTIAAVATTMAVVVGSLAVAGLVSIERRRGRVRLTASFDAVLMLPLGASAVTVGLGLLLAFSRQPLDLRGSVVMVPLAQALVALPFVVRIMLPAARAIDRRVRDAAAVLGASPLRVLLEVDAPMLARPLSVAAGFAFAVSMGEFGATLVLARPDVPTLPLTLARLLGQPGAVNRGQAMAVATLLMVVTAAVVLVADRGRADRGRADA